MNLPRSELSVGVLIPKMRVEIMPPAMWQEADRLTRIEAEVAHPTLTMTVVAGGQVAVDRTVVERDGQFCAAPRELTIRIGLTERVLLLPAPARRNACVKEALLAHARQIETLEKRIIQDFVAGTRGAFFRKLSALKRIPASTSDDAHQQFRRAVEEMVQATVADLHAARLREVEALEAQTDHSDLANACAGALYDIVWPRRRRA
ncbi:MAG: hypothetical protein AB7O45_08110 [Alphaproteobacteria bacterium]